MPRFKRTLLLIGLALACSVHAAPRASAAGAIPQPTVPCDHNVPVPAEGLQIWDPEADPDGRRTTDGVVCVRLIEDGATVIGAPTTLRRSDRKHTSGRSTDAFGVASYIFYMRGGRIHVQVTSTYRNAQISAELDVVR